MLPARVRSNLAGFERQECNDPDLALDRVAEGLLSARYDGVLDAARQHEPSERYDVEALVQARSNGPQLSLFT